MLFNECAFGKIATSKISHGRSIASYMTEIMQFLLFSQLSHEPRKLDPQNKHVCT